jgi:DDE superfamily endonuclease
MINIGSPGRQSDGGVFKNSNLGISLERDMIPLPPPSEIYDGGPKLPYYFIGDEGFPLKTYMQRPYAGKATGNLPEGKRIYNYRVSRARRVIENSFGILTTKWRVLRKPIHASPDKVKDIVTACILLHNFCLIEEEHIQAHQRTYRHPTLVDREVDGIIVEGDWRSGEPMSHSTFTQFAHVEPDTINSFTANKIREELTEYFMTVGNVKWQFQ